MVIDIFTYIVPTKEFLHTLILELPKQMSGYAKIFGPTMAALIGIEKEEYDRLVRTMPERELLEYTAKKAEVLLVPLKDFVEDLDAAGIEYACIPNFDEETISGVKPVPNEHIAEIVRDYPDKFIGFAGVDPHKGKAAVQELDKAVNKMDLKGLCVRPFMHGLYADDKRYHALYAKCVELGIPVWIHSSNNWSLERTMDFGHPRSLDRVAIDFPDLKIIAGHGGWPWVMEMVVVAWRHPNVYIDTSAHRPRHFSIPGSGWEPLLHFGNTTIQDKVLFGSAWILLGMPPQAVIEEIRRLPLKEEVKEKWLHKNAERLLGLR